MHRQSLKTRPPAYQKREHAVNTVVHLAAHQSLLRSKQRHSKAAFKLGNRHFVAKDATKAIRCYELAANVGHAGTQYNLGLTYLKGEGVPRDALNGLRWLAEAADGGDKKAQALLQRIDQALVAK